MKHPCQLNLNSTVGHGIIHSLYFIQRKSYIKRRRFFKRCFLLRPYAYGTNYYIEVYLIIYVVRIK